MKYLLVLIITASIQGCVTQHEMDAKEIRRYTGQVKANLLSLKIDMSKTEVMATMGSQLTSDNFPIYAKEAPHRLSGTPYKSEAYATKNGSILEYWFFYTELATERTGMLDKHLTPLCFIDGKLKGWGRNFYDDTIKIRKEIIRKDK